MLILSGHIVELNNLKLLNDNELIISNRFNFIAVQSLVEDSAMDVNYIVYDTKKNIFQEWDCRSWYVTEVEGIY